MTRHKLTSSQQRAIDWLKDGLEHSRPSVLLPACKQLMAMGYIHGEKTFFKTWRIRLSHFGIVTFYGNRK